MKSLMTNRLRYALFALLVSAGTAWAQSSTHVDVFKDRYCGCCEQWIKHLWQNGFEVNAQDVNDVPAARKRLGMPDNFGACHTASIGGYVIEGHVPAADIQRLLKEKPKAIGLAVPSMPPGSPGMETANPVHYETLLVLADGSTRVFAKH